SDGELCDYEQYSVWAKHGLKLNVCNLFWKTALGPVGNPAPPQSRYGIRFEKANSFHTQRAYGPLLRLSNDELFSFYGARLGDLGFAGAMKADDFWRLPYVTEYQRPSIGAPIDVLLELNPLSYVGRFTEPALVEGFKANSTHYEENELAAIDRIAWIGDPSIP